MTASAVRRLLLVLLVMPAVSVTTLSSQSASSIDASSRTRTRIAHSAAMTTAIEQGNWVEAERQARLVLAREKVGIEQYYARRYLGVALAAQDRCDEALRTFGAAAVPDVAPHSWAAFYGNGMFAECLERVGRLSDALAAYRMALAAEWQLKESELRGLAGRPKLAFVPNRPWLEQKIARLLGRLNDAPPDSPARWLGVWRSAYGTRLELAARSENTGIAIALQLPTTYGCRGQAAGAIETDLRSDSAVAAVASDAGEQRVCRLTLTLSADSAHIDIVEDAGCRLLQEARCGFADRYERVPE